MLHSKTFEHLAVSLNVQAFPVHFHATSPSSPGQISSSSMETSIRPASAPAGHLLVQMALQLLDVGVSCLDTLVNKKTTKMDEFDTLGWC